jgi:hypothetical protein
MNLTAFRDVLNADNWPHLVFMHNNCDRPDASIRLFPCLPFLPCSVLDGTIQASWTSSGMHAIVSTLDDRSNARLPWWPWCDSLRLYGFEEPGNSTPYHYWSDGSSHDGHTAAEWYTHKRKDGHLDHNFRREHAFMRGDLGGNASSVGPFTIHRKAGRRVCRTDDSHPGVPAKSSVAPAKGRRTVPKVSPLAARRNATDAHREKQRLAAQKKLPNRTALELLELDGP